MCSFLQTQGIVFSYNEYGVSHSLKENLNLLKKKQPTSTLYMVKKKKIPKYTIV